MATDATGTPTSPDNIPTYNTSVDAPSGLGFNAAMAAVQTALSARTSKPAGIVTGETPVWNGSTWDRSSVTNIGATSLGSGTPDATKFLRGDSSWQTAGSVPSGVVAPFAGSAAPATWSLCDGSAISRTTFSALFAAIGTAYGVGDGSTTFNLPDMQGRAPVGKGTHADVSALANSDGLAAAARRPKHKHTVNDPQHSHTENVNGTAANGVNKLARGDAGGPVTEGGGINAAATGITIGPQTGNEPTDGPAYLVFNYIIKQ